MEYHEYTTEGGLSDAEPGGISARSRTADDSDADDHTYTEDTEDDAGAGIIGTLAELSSIVVGGVTELFLPDISPEPSLSSSASSVAATPAAPTTVQQHGGNGGGGGGKAAVWGAGPSSGLFTGLGRGSRPHSPEARGGRPAGSGREAAADESPFPFNSAFGMGLSTPPPRRRVSGNGGAGDGDGAGGSSARGRGRAGGGRVWDAQEQASPGVPWSTSRRLGDAAPANSLVGSPTGRGGLFGAMFSGFTSLGQHATNLLHRLDKDFDNIFNGDDEDDNQEDPDEGPAGGFKGRLSGPGGRSSKDGGISSPGPSPAAGRGTATPSEAIPVGRKARVSGGSARSRVAGSVDAVGRRGSGVGGLGEGGPAAGSLGQRLQQRASLDWQRGQPQQQSLLHSAQSVTGSVSYHGQLVGGGAPAALGPGSQSDARGAKPAAAGVAARGKMTGSAGGGSIPKGGAGKGSQGRQGRASDGWGVSGGSDEDDWGWGAGDDAGSKGKGVGSAVREGGSKRNASPSAQRTVQVSGLTAGLAAAAAKAGAGARSSTTGASASKEDAGGGIGKFVATATGPEVAAGAGGATSGGGDAAAAAPAAGVGGAAAGVKKTRSGGGGGRRIVIRPAQKQKHQQEHGASGAPAPQAPTADAAAGAPPSTAVDTPAVAAADATTPGAGEGMGPAASAAQDAAAPATVDSAAEARGGGAVGAEPGTGRSSGATAAASHAQGSTAGPATPAGAAEGEVEGPGAHVDEVSGLRQELAAARSELAALGGELAASRRRCEELEQENARLQWLLTSGHGAAAHCMAAATPAAGGPSGATWSSPASHLPHASTSATTVTPPRPPSLPGLHPHPQTLQLPQLMPIAAEAGGSGAATLGGGRPCHSCRGSYGNPALAAATAAALAAAAAAATPGAHSRRSSLGGGSMHSRRGSFGSSPAGTYSAILLPPLPPHALVPTAASPSHHTPQHRPTTPSTPGHLLSPGLASQPQQPGQHPPAAGSTPQQHANTHVRGDELVEATLAAQLQAALAEKARLAQENDQLVRHLNALHELLAYTTEQQQQQSGGAYGLSEAEDADGYGYGFSDQPLYGEHQPYTHFDHPYTLPDAPPAQLLQLGTEGERSLRPVAVAALEALAEQPAPAAAAPAAAAGVGSGGGDGGAAAAAACADAVAAVGGPSGDAAPAVEGKETRAEGTLAAEALAGDGRHPHVQGAGQAGAAGRGSIGGVDGVEDAGELWDGAACSWVELEVGLGLGEALEGELSTLAPLHDMEELHADFSAGVHPVPQEAAVLAGVGLPSLEAEAAAAGAAAGVLLTASGEPQEAGRIPCELEACGACGEACGLPGEVEPGGAAQHEGDSSHGSSAGTSAPVEVVPTAPCSLAGDVKASHHNLADQATPGVPLAEPPDGPPAHAETERSGTAAGGQELLLHSSIAAAVKDEGAAAQPARGNSSSNSADISTAASSEQAAAAKPERLYPPASRATGAPLTHRAAAPSLPPQPPARVSSSGGDGPQPPRTARPGLQQVVQLPQASLPLQPPQQEQQLLLLLQQQLFGDTDKAPMRCGSYPDGWEVLDEEGESLQASKGEPVPQPSSEAGQVALGSPPSTGGDRGPRSHSVGGYPVAGVCSSPGAVGPEHAGQVGGWLMGHEMVSEAVAATHVIPVESGSEEEGEDAGSRL